MALTDEQKRKTYLYLGVTQAAAAGTSGGLLVTAITHKLGAALNSLTAIGETTVVALLVILDGLYLKLQTVDDSLLVQKAGPVALRSDEFKARLEQFNYFARQLDSAFFPEGDGVFGGSGGGASSMQGPFSEP